MESKKDWWVMSGVKKRKDFALSLDFSMGMMQ
jgi:hypothetical protein